MLIGYMRVSTGEQNLDLHPLTPAVHAILTALGMPIAVKVLMHLTAMAAG